MYLKPSLRLGFPNKILYAFLTSPTLKKDTGWISKVSNPDRGKNVFFSQSSSGVLGLKRSPIRWEPGLFWLG